MQSSKAVAGRANGAQSKKPPAPVVDQALQSEKDLQELLRSMQAMRAGGVPVAPGEQTLRAAVTVSFELAP